ncbi:MAG TPA: hypothetical protein VHY91_05805 [Pirellulales bacterium]|jgi:hypothetical protein|nr:hypothetical protein [Pirellulales bacterium]
MFLLHVAANLMSTVGIFGFFFCLLWLVWSAYRDGEINDAFWFLATGGMPIVRYLFNQWSRAKWPVVGLLLCAVLLSAGDQLNRRIAPPKRAKADPGVGPAAAHVAPRP